MRNTRLEEIFKARNIQSMSFKNWREKKETTEALVSTCLSIKIKTYILEILQSFFEAR